MKIMRFNGLLRLFKSSEERWMIKPVEIEDDQKPVEIEGDHSQPLLSTPLLSPLLSPPPNNKLWSAYCGERHKVVTYVDKISGCFGYDIHITAFFKRFTLELIEKYVIMYEHEVSHVRDTYVILIFMSAINVAHDCMDDTTELTLKHLHVAPSLVEAAREIQIRMIYCTNILKFLTEN